MMPISSVSAGAPQPLAAAEKALEASRVPTSEEEAQNRQTKPATDQYVRSEPQNPSGRYWMSKDEDGQPKVSFNDPSRTADALKKPEHIPDAQREADPADPDANGPEKDGEGERWVCDTSKVDREIEKLKKKQQELEQRLASETDEAKARDLERQQAQVEQELKEKDNDTYRRQNSTFTRLS